MTDHGFDVDLVLGPRRSARIAWTVASVATGVAALLAIAIIAMMPLRETEVFTVLVDRTTGDAERIVQVQPVGISEETAVKEALLVGYVTDRESFIRAGIQERLEGVQRRSTGPARASLQRLWTDDADNADYPPRLYGSGAEVSVRIRAINFLEPTVAQVRFEKTLRRARSQPVTRAFVATAGFEFDPRRERRLERVWENPLGFRVTTYQVDAETLEG